MSSSRKQLKSTQSVPLRRPGEHRDRRTVLLVDDDEAARDRLTRELYARGWNVIVATDVRTAVERAGDEQPFAIISELVLPDARGYNFARTLKTMVEHDVVVIGVTKVDARQFDDALKAGFDATFAKPVDIDMLHALLQLNAK
jgi:DNA-binding response OmpR family regulator